VGVTLASVRFSEKAALREVFDPYLIAHADVVDPERVHGDPTLYEHFDAYWVEPERRPFWILRDGERAGFILINRWAPSGQTVDHAIAEFCVLPGARGRGVGQAAVGAALSTHAGQWELQVYRATHPAMAFWPKALAASGARDWERIEREDRIIHRFRSGQGPKTLTSPGTDGRRLMRPAGSPPGPAG
jgi:predicted acetyltransferase